MRTDSDFYLVRPHIDETTWCVDHYDRAGRWIGTMFGDGSMTKAEAILRAERCRRINRNARRRAKATVR